MRKHILIDGGNLLHRAFHVFVSPCDGEHRYESNSGYPTGMIYGPLSFLSDWIPSIGRFDTVNMFVDGRPSRRRAMDPTYKVRDGDARMVLEQRAIELPDGTAAGSETGVLLHIMKLAGVRVFYDPEEEADDLIASFIRANERDVHVVVSSDKDFFQLLTNPRVAIYRPGTDAGHRFLDAEGAENHWASLQKGKHPKVSAAGVRMFKTLCGDPSDNIPGVPRLRKRIAAQISDSPTVTLDELKNADWPGLSDMEKERARGMFDRLKLNWELVGLVDTLQLRPAEDVQPNLAMAQAVAKSLDIHLDLSFLVPSAGRCISAEAPAEIVDSGSDWFDSI